MHLYLFSLTVQARAVGNSKATHAHMEVSHHFPYSPRNDFAEQLPLQQDTFKHICHFWQYYSSQEYTENMNFRLLGTSWLVHVVTMDHCT